MASHAGTAFALTAALAMAPPAAAQPGSAPVRLQFRAIGADGSPVLDLAQGDLTLKIDGKPRQIGSISLHRPGGTDTGRPLPPPYATNANGASARTLQLLVDDDSIAPGREAPFKQALQRLVAELSAGDRVGLSTPQARVMLAPTADRTIINQTIDRLVGQGHTSESDADIACRTTSLLKALGGVIANASVAPTTIAVFSAGIMGPSVQMAQIGKSSGECLVRTDDFQNLSRVAAAAPVEVYLFHLMEGLTTSSSAQTAGFESLAGAVNGEFVRVGTDASASLSKLLRETSAYYEAQFQAEPEDRNGQSHRVELRTARDRVRLRTRPALAIPKAAAAARSPQDLLRAQAESRDLPLRLTGYAARNPGSDDVKIMAMFEAMDAAPLKAASVALFDEKNTLKRQWTAQPADLARRPVMAALSAPHGTYRLRVAAVDGTGRVGTADLDMTAEITRADPLRLSALVMGVQENGAFAPRLEFTNELAAIGLLEIYGVPKTGDVVVTLDVLPSETEAPLASAPTQITRTKTEDMLIAFGGFDIAGLPPGDYLMRATVTLDGKPVGRVMRTLRKAR